MITISKKNSKETLCDAIESLAYQLLHYQHPTYYSIDDEEIAILLKSEGLILEDIDS